MYENWGVTAWQLITAKAISFFLFYAKIAPTNFKSAGLEGS